MNTHKQADDRGLVPFSLLDMCDGGGGGGGLVVPPSGRPEHLQGSSPLQLQGRDTDGLPGPSRLLQVLLLSPAAGETRAQRRAGQGG